MEVNETPAEDAGEQKRIRTEKLNGLTRAGKNPFALTVFRADYTSGKIVSGFGELEGKRVSAAGRIVSRRLMGKAAFCHILDGDGKIQTYVREDHVGAESYADFNDYDIGDIIGVAGEVFKTKTGEISVKADKVTLLAKALLPLPEKYHGLQDVEIRYRRRYVDLIANPEVKEVFIKRAKIISKMREYLDARGFIEAETPILSNIAGGAAARPFITKHNALNIEMYLRIATELHLKRLIVGGFPRIYEIGRIFRNEGMDNRHNPEFTTVELYEAYTDYNGMMELTEDLIKFLSREVNGTLTAKWGGEEFDLSKKWKRLTMVEAVKKYAKLDFAKLDAAKAKKELEKKGVKADPKKDSWGELLLLAFDEFVEKELREPTYITDHPIENSPLAKRKATDPRLTERVELFIAGREIANAYSELNDPMDQRQRFTEQMKMREKGDLEAHEFDEDFVTALEYGMPPTGGLGIGIDRLVMLLTDNQNIRDVLLFPTMKPVK